MYVRRLWGAMEEMPSQSFVLSRGLDHEPGVGKSKSERSSDTARSHRKVREIIYMTCPNESGMALKGEIIEKIAALLTVAFGLVAALAWNGAIQAIFKSVFGEAENIPAMLSYAVIVTIIAVIVTIWIARLSEKAKAEE